CLTVRVFEIESVKKRGLHMTSRMFDRRKLMGSLAAMFSAIGMGSLMTGTALARKSKDSGVRKLNRDGKPADGKQMITPLISPNGGPARTTVEEAALPGKSMIEINCIAAIVRK